MYKELLFLFLNSVSAISKAYFNLKLLANKTKIVKTLKVIVFVQNMNIIHFLMNFYKHLYKKI